jgi:hypothetical protein
MHTSKSNYYRSKTYLLNQWMDLMYLSTLDLPGSLISESRTSASSSSQVSMASPTCTHPVHSQPVYVLTLYTDTRVHVCTLYTASPRMYAPYSQTTRVHVLTLYTDNPRTPQKIGFFVFVVILRISPSTLHATSDVRHFRCIHKYLQ